jgi:lysophospholipase L1-like esterase
MGFCRCVDRGLTGTACDIMEWLMNRRVFLRSGAAAAATGVATFSATQRSSAASREAAPGITKGAVVLFQGDSITDAGRTKGEAAKPNDQASMGNGYAWLAASQLLVDRPSDNLTVHNRGISGHKVPQLAARWDKDCLDLKPDVLSILIGVNDIWHKLNGTYEGTPESYEKEYMALIEQTMKALPKVKLVVCEPFVLRCGAVKDDWFPSFDQYRAAAKKVADTHGALFVPFQSMFDEASKIAPPEHWAKDGVHPSSFGASLMAHTWLNIVA